MNLNPFVLTTCVHQTPAIELTDASKEIHAFLRGIVCCNWMKDPRYIIRQKAGAFFQGGSNLEEGWILIEFWNKANAQEFVDFANELWRKENTCHKIEYDTSYFGGDYSGVGDFAYIPEALLERCETLEDAFELMTGADRKNIICTYDDERVTTEGDELDD